MKTLAELEKEQREYVRYRGGHWEIGEGDWRINKFSRAKVRAFRREHGEAWMGNINFYDETPPNFTQYIKGIVRNFEYAFVIPHNDPVLKGLIDKRNETPYTGTEQDSMLIEPIFDRLEAIGGISLNWA